MIMDIVTFQEKLKTAAVDSEALTLKIKASEKEFDTLYPLIRQYLYFKFMLPEGCCASDDILELAAASVELIAGLKKGGLKFEDRSGSCGAISSSVTKKILLLISLQKALSIQFSKEESPAILTITELTHSILQHMQG